MIDDLSYLVKPLEEKLKFPNKDDSKKFVIDFSDKAADKLKKQAELYKKFIYTKNYELLVNDMPDIVTNIRKFILYGGAFIIQPLLIIPVYIADKMIEEKVNAKEADRVLKKYDREIKSLTDKIDKETNPDKKLELTKLRRYTMDGKAKVEHYRDGLHVEREHSDDDFNFDFNFEGVEIKNMINDKEMVLEDYHDIYDQLTWMSQVFEGVEIIDKYDYLNESELSSKAKQTSAKVKSGINKGVRTAKVIDKKTGDKADNTVDKIVTDVKKRLVGETREDIIRNNSFKLSRVIRNGILVGTVYAINPALAAIGVITGIALKKNLKRKEKMRLLSELKSELDIVEEKIKDADSAGDKEKKYQLMRIRIKLKRDIERIQYNMENLDAYADSNNDD